MPLSFPALIADKLKTENFVLLDIGCSGGLDPMWRAFEPRLRALGIDASATECQRLAGLERNPDVSYVAAFVSSAADKPVDHSAGGLRGFGQEGADVARARRGFLKRVLDTLREGMHQAFQVFAAHLDAVDKRFE